MTRLTRDHGADAHGESALLLAESMLHALVARSVFTTQEAIEIVRTASEVTEELAVERHGSPMTPLSSLTLLQNICDSLAIDVDKPAGEKP